MRLSIKLVILMSGKRQWQVARAANIHETRLSKYIQGYGRLSGEEKARLAEVLGISLEEDDEDE
jgi:plasmid maintenance system antidote protein VapI